MYIYIITHPEFEGWIKLGRAINVENRLISYQTNCPNRDYKLEFKIKTEYYNNIETYFDKYIKGNGYEWYKYDTQDAINIINNIEKGMKEDLYYSIKNNIIRRKYKNFIKYDYIVDDIIYNTIRELSEYIGLNYTYCNKILGKIKINTIVEINGFKVIKQKHY